MSPCLVDAEPESASGRARHSVYDEGAAAAARHKWIESEKAGYDLGERAIHHWVREHWNRLVRSLWLEHLNGQRFWTELDHDDFGLLQGAFHDSALIRPILDRLIAGHENLNIILWAQEKRLPMPDVLAILESLDINSRRLEFKVDEGFVLA
jgi:hypothetical protein